MSGGREVWILLRRELRAALRERSVVLSTIVMPVLLYPLLLWLAFSIGSFVQGQQERQRSRLVVLGDSPELVESVAEILRGGSESGQQLEWVDGPEADHESARERVAAGELDLAVMVFPVEAPAGNYRVELLWDTTVGRSAKARDRVEDLLSDHRGQRIEEEVERLGIGPETWLGFEIERRNLATRSEMGAFVLGLMAPLFTILMIAVGCFYTAIDTTAGERERSTWETSLTLAVSRDRVVLAKFLTVALLGWTAGLLNLVALSVSLRAILAPALGASQMMLQFSLPWRALPLLFLASALLALFIAAGMMLFAAFARTFKEGQSMVTPFYLLCLLPAMVVQAPDLELTAGWALVPIANVALVLRDAITGTYHWPWIGLTLAVEVATVLACLALARRVMADENVMTGAFEGSFAQFVRRELLGHGRERSGESL